MIYYENDLVYVSVLQPQGKVERVIAKDKSDMSNEPTVYTRKKRNLKKLLEYLEAHSEGENLNSDITFRGIRDKMDNLWLDSKYYCAMD